jgi:anti-anti-sigma factor
MNLSVTVASHDASTTLHVGGDLDYESTATLISAVSDVLNDCDTDADAVTDLRLDFTDLSFCDSAGLSGLLLIHRQTSAAGVHLHLDHRPAQLQRILDITGVLEHLTTAPAREATSESGIV